MISLKKRKLAGFHDLVAVGALFLSLPKPPFFDAIIAEEFPTLIVCYRVKEKLAAYDAFEKLLIEVIHSLRPLQEWLVSLLFG